MIKNVILNILKHEHENKLIKQFQFSIQEGWWRIGIKRDGGAKSKETRLLIDRPILEHTVKYDNMLLI